jgi:hypothetical protein
MEYYSEGLVYRLVKRVNPTQDGETCAGDTSGRPVQGGCAYKRSQNSSRTPIRAGCGVWRAGSGP